MTEMIITSPSVNWSSFLSQVKRDYETPPALGIYHGLQKDAIQNGWGARVSDRGWSFEFRIVRIPNGSLLLTMTDHGTTGLVGKVFDYQDSKLPEDIPPTEKLARFECMFDSGGGVGPGLFGRGKLLFNVASRQSAIIYDSLTIEKQYRLGGRRIKGRKCEQLRRVLENDTARAELKRYSGGTLSPLEQPGTRITIVDPIDEVVDSIRNGTFLQAINETWWEIINKYKAKIVLIDENGKTEVAKVPYEFGSLPQSDENNWKVYYKQNLEVQINEKTYRIKHLHLLLPPLNHVVRDELLGISIHRRGMKVGTLQLSGIPDQISDRFFGYVQLNPDFEELIAQTENTTHYGFATRHSPAYRELKKTVQENLDLFMQKLGFRASQKEENERAQRILNEAKADLDNILNGLGVPGFGMGSAGKDEITISVKDLVFPNGSNYVNLDAIISGFKYRLKNTSTKTKTVLIEVFTRESGAGVVETLLPKTKVIIKDHGQFETGALTLNLRKGLYSRGKKIGCTAQVLDEKGEKLCEKTFYVYIDMPVESVDEKATILLASADWPRSNSHRVDYNQKIKNIIYDIENLTALPMKVKLKVGTIWADEKERIDTISDAEIDLSPFEKNQYSVSEIMVSKEKYSEIDKGKIILRCHATALETTNLWEKGERLAESNVTFFLNMDPRYGFFEETKYKDFGPSKPMSWAEPVEGGLQRYRICINSTHPAYTDVSRKDDVERRNYLFKEMARQTVYVLLHRNQTEAIKKLAKLANIVNLDEMAADDVLSELAYPITDRILSEYYGV
jgi:hypothetical protein